MKKDPVIIVCLVLIWALFFVEIAKAQTHTFCPTDGGGTGICSYTATQDFSNVTLMKLRVAAALTASVNGDCGGLDTTANNVHCWNGADAVIPLIPSASLPLNGQIARYTVVGGKVTESGIGPAHGIMNSVFCSTASGSGTTYTCTTSPSFTPADGDIVDFDADVTNTGPITLNVNGAGAVAVKKWTRGASSPLALIAGDIQANQPTWLYFDSGLNIWSEMSPVAQTSCSDLSNAAASCSTDATNAANISSGTLAAARGGAGTITGALKGNGLGVVSQAAAVDLSNGITGSGAIVLGTSPTISSPTLTGTSPSGRIRFNQGTALSGGSFILSASWGSTASAGLLGSGTGNDSAFALGVTTNGTGQAANPTISLTFADGTWTAAPVCVTSRRDTLATPGYFTANTTATSLTITFVGTPAASQSYQVNVICGGVP